MNKNFENYLDIRREILLELPESDLKLLVDQFKNSTSDSKFDDMDQDLYCKYAGAIFEPEYVEPYDSRFEDINLDDPDISKLNNLLMDSPVMSDVLNSYGLLSDCSESVLEFLKVFDIIGY